MMFTGGGNVHRDLAEFLQHDLHDSLGQSVLQATILVELFFYIW